MEVKPGQAPDLHGHDGRTLFPLMPYQVLGAGEGCAGRYDAALRMVNIKPEA